MPFPLPEEARLKSGVQYTPFLRVGKSRNGLIAEGEESSSRDHWPFGAGAASAHVLMMAERR